MGILQDIGAIDIIHRLPRRNWIIGKRRKTTLLVWHYNGPPVPTARQYGQGLIEQLRIDAAWQMRAGWGGTKGGAPGLMYALVFDALGNVYQTQPLDDILWHCANEDGNSHGLALHVPVGGSQVPSDACLTALKRTTSLLCSYYKIPKNRVLGHKEVKPTTACPGVSLMNNLRAWRMGMGPIVKPTPTPIGLRRFVVREDLTMNVNVRQGPGVRFPVAGRYKPGSTVFVDTINQAEPPNADNPQWAHMARVGNEQADLGFIALGLLREVT